MSCNTKVLPIASHHKPINLSSAQHEGDSLIQKLSWIVRSPQSQRQCLLVLKSKSDGGGNEFQKRKNQVVGESKENIQEAEDTLKVLFQTDVWLGTCI